MVVGEAFSKHGVFLGFSPIFLHDLLHAINDEFKS
jgi:hypothetical protein